MKYGNMRFFRLAALATAVIIAAFAAVAQRPVHVRWTTRVEATGPSTGVVTWTADIDEGWHIYGTDAADATPTEIVTDSVEGLQWTGALTPSVKPAMHFDETLKLKLPWWEGRVSFTRPFAVKGQGAAISGTIIYMACTADACTPPVREPFEVTFGTPATSVTPAAPDVRTQARPTPEPASESDLWKPVDVEAARTADATISSATSWWAIIGLGFLGGLLALLTPCVWPMIPMTVSFFLKKGKSRRKAIFDAITYGLSIIVIYLVLGIALTMLFGAGKLNEVATSAVFNVLFFVLLVIFAVSFFGAFEIKLPSRWSNAIDSKAESTTGVISIFFMAFTLVLVSFSCTGPIIGTLLVEAAATADILGPALGMGGFALGLALPFALFAFFPSLLKEMPRSGSWLNTVKVVLGFIELILAFKFLSVADLAYGWGILDREIFLAIWIVLFVLLGMYLLGRLRFAHDGDTGHVSVLRFFAAVASLSFAVYLLPGMWGAPLKGVSAFTPPLSTQDFNLYGGTFKEFHDYDEGMAYAREKKLPVLVDFSGYACVNCRKMEGAVFDTPDVRTILEREYVLIKLMVDDKQPLETPIEVEEYGGTTTLTTVGDRWSYLQRHKFGINSQPYYVILDNDGDLLGRPRAYDENVADFVGWLNDGMVNFKK